MSETPRDDDAIIEAVRRSVAPGLVRPPVLSLRRQQATALLVLGVVVLVLAFAPLFFTTTHSSSQSASGTQSVLSQFALFERGEPSQATDVTYVRAHAQVTPTASGNVTALFDGHQCFGVTSQHGVVSGPTVVATSYCSTFASSPGSTSSTTPTRSPTTTPTTPTTKAG